MIGRIAFALYAGLGRVLALMAPRYLERRVQRGKEDAARLGERYGDASIARPAGPLVWIHAASIGESIAASGLAGALAGQGIAVLVTTGTVTSARIVARRLAGIAIHQFAPLDAPAFVARFLDHWRPDLVILVESEIWPTTVAALDARGVPRVLVNARMSDASFKAWGRAGRLARPLFEGFATVLAQSPEDARRFVHLGARHVVAAGNLKAEIAAETPSVNDAEALKTALGDRPVIVAISTHDGEEAILVETHRAIAAAHPRLLTVIVPRHVERAAAIRAEIDAAGLPVRTRSLDRLPDDETVIFLGDTTGEIGFYLAMAEIVFMGKSMAASGGQNPLEAVLAGCAVVSGPNVGNFRDVYARLDAAGGLVTVRSGGELEAALDRLLRDPAERQSRIRAAQAAAHAAGGALDATMRELAPLLARARNGDSA